MSLTTPATPTNSANQSGFFYMCIMKYNKQALDVDQQIILLESRGLIIPDRDKARQSLQFINYYRLSGYTISFEEVNNGKRGHHYKAGVTFEDVLALYDFDRHLRMLVMDAIERIEVAIRTQICISLAVSYDDSHWHLNRELFKENFNYKAFLSKCTEEQKNSKERFVMHYKQIYDTPELVPSWMTIELLPLGTWSIVYKNLKNRSDRKRVSDVFKLSSLELESWLHVLTYIRNLCAHHSRLWNRHFTLRPKQPPGYIKYFSPNTTFATQAAMMHLLLKIISPQSKWTARLYELIQSHSFIHSERMGFVMDWQDDEFWDIFT